MLKEETKPGVFPLGLSLSFNTSRLQDRSTCYSFLESVLTKKKCKQESFNFNASCICGHFAIDHISPVQCDVRNTAFAIPKASIELVILRQTF